MADSRPLSEVVADEATAALLRVRNEMVIRGETMKRSHVRATILGVLAKHLATFKQRARPPQHKPYNAMTEAEFIACLEAEPSLAGTDIKREIGKCQFWCKANEKQPTRKRIINWLNRADRQLVFNGAGASSLPARGTRGGPPEPAGWRVWLDTNRPECAYATGQPGGGRQWADLEQSVKHYIAEQIRLGP